MLDSRINWVLLSNAALGSFLAGTASRIFAVSLPTVASSLETTIVGISWAVIAYQISQISLSLVFGRIGDIYGRQTLFGLGLVVSAIGALSMRSLPKRDTAYPVSIIPGRRRFHDSVPGPGAGHGFATEGVIRQSAGFYDHGFSHGSTHRPQRGRLHH